MSCQDDTQATETKKNEPPVSQKRLPSDGKVASGGLRVGEMEARVLNVTQKIKERGEIEQQEQFWNDINAGFFGWELTESHPFYKTFLLWKEMKKEEL